MTNRLPHSRWLNTLCLSLCVVACDDSAAPSGELMPVAGVSSPGGGPPPTSSGLTVSAPMQGAITSSPEVTVTGSHPTALMVSVNGQSAPVTNGQFSLTLTLAEGAQSITVTDSSSTVMIDVMVDLTPPLVEISTPAYGSHIDSAQRASITVTGSASDTLSGVSEAMVNGATVPVSPNGAFQYTYQPSAEGLELITVKLLDRAGNEVNAYRSFLFGRFKEWATPVNSSLGAFASTYALDALEQAMVNALSSGLISELITSSIEPGQSFTVEEIEIRRPPVINLEPREGYLDVNLSLSLRVNFTLTSPVGAAGDIYVDAALAAKMYFDVLSGGSLDIRVVEPQVELSYFDFELVNGALGVVADFLEGFIGDFAEGFLLSILEDLLVEGLIEPELFRPTLTVLNTPLQLEVLVEEAEVNPMGIRMQAGLGLSSPDVVRQAPGYLFDTTPVEPEFLPSMVSAFATLNGLQMLLGQIWRAGIMDVNLLDLVEEPPSALSAALLSGFTGGKLVEYMSPTEPVGVRVRPSLPPVGRFSAAEPQAVFVDFNDLLIDLTLPSGEAWLTLGLNLTTRVEPSILNNDLQLTTTISVEAWEVSAPIFEVDSERLLGVLKPLLINLPNLIGVEAGSEPLISITELDLFGVQLSTTTVESRPSPGGITLIGLQVTSP